MNPALEPVRQAILTELSGLSYAERKRLHDSFDGDFVEAELAKIERQTRWVRIGVAFGLGVLALGLGLLLYRDLGGNFGMATCFAVGTHGLILLDYYRRRRILYRVLAALAVADKDLQADTSIDGDG